MLSHLNKKFTHISNPTILLTFILLGAVIYLPSFSLPYIQDDYGILNSIRINGMDYFYGYLLKVGSHHYRPLPQLVFLAYYYLFKDFSLAYHIVNFSLLIVIAFFLYELLKIILMSAKTGIIISCVFLSSYWVLSPLMQWMVGIYDLLSCALFFAGFYLILKNKYWQGNTLLFLALFTKESATFLFLIPLAYQWIIYGKSTAREYLVKTLPFLILSTLFIFVRLAMMSQSAIPTGYEIGYFDVHLIKNSRRYLSVFLSQLTNNRSLLFFLVSRKVTIFFYSLSLVFVIILAARYKKIVRDKLLMFFTFWATVNVIPILILKNHFADYYLIFSYPAFLAILALLTKSIWGRKRVGGPSRKIIVTGLMVYFFSTTVLVSWSQYRYCRGIHENAQIVKSFKAFILTHPNYDNYVVRAKNIFAFDLFNGPELWLNRKVNVYEAEHLRIGAAGRYLILNQPLSQLEDDPKNSFELDKEKTVLVEIKGNRAKKVSANEFTRKSGT